MSSFKLIGILVNFHQNWNKNLMKFFDQSYQIPTFFDQIQANTFLTNFEQNLDPDLTLFVQQNLPIPII
jgi:hypothetical protein